MLTRFNHVAIVVPNLEEAKQKYREILHADVSEINNYKEHGVSVVFVHLGNTKIELMHPYGENSPIKNFLEKNMNGAIHHICLEVKDINKTAQELKKKMLESLVMAFLKMVHTINQFCFFIRKTFSGHSLN